MAKTQDPELGQPRDPSAACQSTNGKKPDAKPETKPLVYPARLSDNQRTLANRYLDTVPVEQRQALLDELEGRIRSEQRGMPPLYDELSFLHALCRALQQDGFIPNLGIKVQEERLARCQRLEKERAERQERQTSQNALDVEKRIEAGKGSITQMRKLLGKSGRSSAPDGQTSYPRWCTWNLSPPTCKQ